MGYFSLAWERAAVLGFVALVVGCGGGPADVAAPMIFRQPVNASVPMGLTATFSVSANGSGLEYQWLRNGVAIAGATDRTYTTPQTAFSDDGESFTVQVSNRGGSETSNAAHLSVTARAPLTGDLRFQQVDAATTVGGYIQETNLYSPSMINCPSPGGSAVGLSFGGGTGTPFVLTDSYCLWQFLVMSTPGAMTTVYSGSDISQLSTTLSQRLGATPSADDPESVLITAGVTPVMSNFVAFGYVNAGGTQAFTRNQAAVDVSGLQAAIAQEGASGRVVTAMYLVGNSMTYFSYSWAGDPNGVYETKVVSGNQDQVTMLVQGLAAEGYILTASTTTQAGDGSGVWLVGARLRGDTKPRPILVQNGGIDTLESGGYAIVSWVRKWVNGIAQDTFIGER